MARAPDVQFKFRINRTTKSGAVPALQDALALAGKFRGILKEEAVQRARQVLAFKIYAHREDIVRDVEADLVKFGRQVANFFTSIKSPDTRSTPRRGPQPSGTVQIRMDQFEIYNANVLRVRDTGRTKRPVSAIRWQALSPRTLQSKKRNRTTFFLHTGELKAGLAEALGPAYAALVAPRIEFSVPNEETAVVTVKALLNPRFRSQLFTDRADVGDRIASESLILGYLKTRSAAVSIEKLANLGRLVDGTDDHFNRPHRPFIQPALAFWVLRRLPVVFQSSVAKALKRERRRRTDYGGRQFEGT